MPNFLSQIGEEVSQAFITDPEQFERYVANQLWSSGRNNYGQLGNNITTDRSSPVQTVSGGTNWKFVSAGSSRSAAIKADNSLWLWGNNYGGQLGDNTRTNRSSPVQTVSAGTNWKLVAGGVYHTAAIKTDGTLWTWGRNDNGQLGTNNITHRSSPVQTVSGGTNWKVLAAGNYHTAAIKTDGTLWSWGRNTSGQLGDNSTTNRSSPVQTVSGGTNWKQISTGSSNAGAIKTDGTLWLWGSNGNGQIGDNSSTNRSSPVQTVSAGNNWRQVSCGVSNTGAIKTDGTLWMWGSNGFGQLGDNTTNPKSSPVQTISAGTNWKEIELGRTTTWSSAIKTDGTLWMWGSNANGQLGTNNLTHRSSPVQTVAGGNNWKLVSAGNYHFAAVTYKES